MTTIYAPPFSERCYECCDPAFVVPFEFVAVEFSCIKCKYRCPNCGVMWQQYFNGEGCGDEYANPEKYGHVYFQSRAAA